MGKGNTIRAYNQMMALEYTVKYKKRKITIGEALRILQRLECKRGENMDIKG